MSAGKQGYLHPRSVSCLYNNCFPVVCRILPHCAHAADMNFYLSIFWILIRIGIQRCRFWSTSQFLLSAGYPSEPSSTDEDSDPYPPFYLGKKTFFRFFSYISLIELQLSISQFSSIIANFFESHEEPHVAQIAIKKVKKKA